MHVLIQGKAITLYTIEKKEMKKSRNENRLDEYEITSL